MSLLRPTIVVLLVTGCATQPNVAVTPSRPAAMPGELLGEWEWVRSCEAVVRVFRRAGLAERTRSSLVDARYFAHESQIRPARPCDGAEETRYVYFFEPPHRWGVLDDDDVLVDDREFEVVDANTIAFDEVQLDLEITREGSLTFGVRVQDGCRRGCLYTYAWALAVFGAGAFQRVAGTA